MREGITETAAATQLVKECLADAFLNVFAACRRQAMLTAKYVSAANSSCDFVLHNFENPPWGRLPSVGGAPRHYSECTT